VLASAARAACVLELNRCVGPCVVVVATVEVSLFVVVSLARRRSSCSIDGCAYDSCATSDDGCTVDEVAATSSALSTSVAVSVVDFDTAVDDR